MGLHESTPLVVMGIGWIFIIDHQFIFNERLSNINYNRFISIKCICLSDSNPRDLYCASMCTYLCNLTWTNDNLIKCLPEMLSMP